MANDFRLVLFTPDSKSPIGGHIDECPVQFDYDDVKALREIASAADFMATAIRMPPERTAAWRETGKKMTTIADRITQILAPHADELA